MTPETAAAIYDNVLPGWRETPPRGRRVRLRAPYRKDHEPSLDLDLDGLVWFDRGTGEGGGAVDLAHRVLGEEATGQLLREIARAETSAPSAAPKPPPRPTLRDDAPTHQVEDLGPLTREQREALAADGRISSPSTPDRMGMRCVRARFSDDDGAWRRWSEYVGVPTLTDGTWKLWGVHADGRVWRNDAGRLVRLNAGGVSLAVSPDLLEGRCGVSRLWDLEGESDLVAAVDHGMTGAISTTGGAGTLQGHHRHEVTLLALAPEEVAIVRDLDDAGSDGAEKASAWWLERSVPVRVVGLPESLGKGGDVRDFLMGRTRGRA